MINRYDNLKIFGCTAYIHSNEGKLEPRAKKGIFLGYPDGVKGYKLWLTQPSGSKSIISRDPVFREEDMQGEKQQEMFGENQQEVLISPKHSNPDHGTPLEVEKSHENQSELDQSATPQMMRTTLKTGIQMLILTIL